MKHYRFIITVTEPNENFEAEYKAWKDRGTWSRDFNDRQPDPTVQVNCLEMVLTEEQFFAVKKAVLEQFN